ncbi:MAG: hypothetical protein AAB439_01040 [Patescibacteria group bacterium]
MSESWWRSLSVDTPVVRHITVAGALALMSMMLITMAKGGAFHWGDVIGADYNDDEIGGKPIPKEFEDQGASNDPNVCKHPGMLIKGVCAWCGAELH